MAKTVLLNNVQHKDLRVIHRYSVIDGDNVGSVLTFPNEFGDVQKEYPILFQINPETGKYQAVVLFGLRQDENLFLNDDGTWSANYIPAVMARGPFLIGYQRDPINPDAKEPAVHVDIDSPKLSTKEGTPLFLEFGGISPYLEKISQLLKGIYDGMALSTAMFEVFSALDLIEPVTLELDLGNGELHRLHSNYTISQAKLAALTGDELAQLNHTGFLGAAFLVVQSLSNIQNLIQRKRAKV